MAFFGYAGGELCSADELAGAVQGQAAGQQYEPKNNNPGLTESQKLTVKLKKLVDMKNDKGSLDLVMLDINDAKADLSQDQYDYLSAAYQKKIASINN